MKFRSYHHILITESKNPLDEIRPWMRENMKDDYRIEPLEVPYSIVDYVSVYIKNKSDLFMFNMRWNPEK